MIEKNNYFLTDEDLKISAVSRDQMMEIDRIAIEETGPNLYQMMENAGRNLAELTINILGNNWTERQIVILAGNGNNGGGGICAARHIANHGGNVTLVLSDENKINEISSYQKLIYKNAGGKSYSLFEAKSSNPDIIIDAIIGYNLKKAPSGVTIELIKWANMKSAKIISLDIPTGVDSNTGEILGEYIKADVTLTLALPKTGLSTRNAGNIYLADIGIPKIVYEKIGINYISPFKNNYIIPITLEN